MQGEAPVFLKKNPTHDSLEKWMDKNDDDDQKILNIIKIVYYNKKYKISQ